MEIFHTGLPMGCPKALTSYLIWCAIGQIFQDILSSCNINMAKPDSWSCMLRWWCCGMNNLPLVQNSRCGATKQRCVEVPIEVLMPDWKKHTLSSICLAKICLCTTNSVCVWCKWMIVLEISAHIWHKLIVALTILPLVGNKLALPAQKRLTEWWNKPKRWTKWKTVGKKHQQSSKVYM